jgi:hypothetical protein
MHDVRVRNPLLTGGNNPGGSDFGGRGGHPGWRSAFSPGMLPPLFSQRGYSYAPISIDARSQRAQAPQLKGILKRGGCGQQTMLSHSQEVSGGDAVRDHSDTPMVVSGGQQLQQMLGYGQQSLLSTSQAQAQTEEASDGSLNQGHGGDISVRVITEDDLINAHNSGYVAGQGQEAQRQVLAGGAQNFDPHGFQAQFERYDREEDGNRAQWKRYYQQNGYSDPSSKSAETERWNSYCLSLVPGGQAQIDAWADRIDAIAYDPWGPTSKVGGDEQQQSCESSRELGELGEQQRGCDEQEEATRENTRLSASRGSLTLPPILDKM